MKTESEKVNLEMRTQKDSNKPISERNENEIKNLIRNIINMEETKAKFSQTENLGAMLLEIERKVEQYIWVYQMYETICSKEVIKKEANEVRNLHKKLKTRENLAIKEKEM